MLLRLYSVPTNFLDNCSRACAAGVLTGWMEMQVLRRAHSMRRKGRRHPARLHVQVKSTSRSHGSRTRELVGGQPKIEAGLRREWLRSKDCTHSEDSDGGFVNSDRTDTLA